MARYTRNPALLRNKVARESQELNLSSQLQLNLLFVAQEGVDTPFFGGLSGGGRKVSWSPESTVAFARLTKQALIALRAQDDVNFGPFFVASNLYLFGDDQQLNLQQDRHTLAIDNLPTILPKRNERDWDGWLQNQSNQRLNLLSPEILGFPLAKRDWDEEIGVPINWVQARRQQTWHAATAQDIFDFQGGMLQINVAITAQVELILQKRVWDRLPESLPYKTKADKTYGAIYSQENVFNPRTLDLMLPGFASWGEPASAAITSTWTEPAVTANTSTWTEPAKTPTV